MNLFRKKDIAHLAQDAEKSGRVMLVVHVCVNGNRIIYKGNKEELQWLKLY